MKYKMLAANWKMNLNLQEASELFADFLETLPAQESNRYVLFAPFVFLPQLSLSNSFIELGAQNFYPADKGAFTGEISISHLKELHVSVVLIGHSERRIHFFESNEFIKQKVDCALAHQMKVVFCCGESIKIRDSNLHLQFIEEQLKASLFHISQENILNCSIAYEPIWAIGTGRTASSEQIEEMHSSIRRLIAQQYDETTAQSVAILYGGSCNSKNAEDIFSCTNVNGGLIGGASLTSEEFSLIANQLN
jgi:triosephosphate isomerase